MANRDIYWQISSNQGYLQSTGAAGSWATGISSDYRSYNPANSKYPTVAPTRASNFDPQKSFSTLTGPGRYSSREHWSSNSSSTSTNANRLTYLAPSASRPNAYFWSQPNAYGDQTKEIFNNQWSYGLSFYRLSNSNNIVLDQIKNLDQHSIYYNLTTFDNNILTISNSGVISKIEVGTSFQDNTTNPTTPLLFQTHGGIPQDGATAWRTDYSRDAYWNAIDSEQYIFYHPSFGSNKQLPINIETLGEWTSNSDGGRSGS